MKVGSSTTKFARLFLGAIFIVSVVPVYAQSVCVRHQFDIPRQSLTEAILKFAQQTQTSVIFPGSDYREIQSNALSGNYCANEALAVLLDGLSVEGEINSNNQLILSERNGGERDTSGSIASTQNSAELDDSSRSIGSFLSSIFLGSRDQDIIADAEQPVFSSPIMEEIMVTGSRITRSGMETPTPVTSISAAQLSVLSPDILIEGMTLLPQFLSNSSPETIRSTTGSLGSSFLNLRGIGSRRTLVLLDGRRAAPSNRLGTPDIAMFPQAVISNVEIVTGGASAAYGSDAVSGVVNYTLDKDFNGLKGYVQYGETSRADNDRVSWSTTWGRDVGEKSHFVFSADYFHADKVETYKGRDWFQNWGTVDVNGVFGTKVVAKDVRSRQYTAGGLIRLPGSDLDRLQFDLTGQPTPFVDGTLIGSTRQVGGTGFLDDFATVEEERTGQGSLYPESERGSAFLFVDYDFNSDFTGFVQYLHGINNINYLANGAHQEHPAWNLTVFEDNAFLPVSIRDIMVDESLESFPLYRLSSKADLGIARGRQENESQNITLGVKGDVQDIRVNGYYQYSNNKNRYSEIDFPRLDRLYKAMDAVVDPSTNNIVCRSTLSFPGDGCQPANPFGSGNMSAAAIDYILEGDMFRLSDLSQHVAEIALDTDLFVDRAEGPISVALGGTYRKETFEQTYGPQHLVALDVLPAVEEGYRGLPVGFEGSVLLQFSGVSEFPLSGEFDVWEIFSEGVIPLVSQRSFVDSLDLNLALRYADYSGSGGVYAWKAGLDWSLNDSLRFRLARSQDTRAATLAERFDRSTGGATVYDPELEEVYSFGQVLGGNSEVDPEIAKSWTAGFVFQPVFLPGFSASADWYDVKVADYISLLGAQSIVSRCSEGVAELCDQITRIPATNRIDIVENVYLNVAEARVQGIDMELFYGSPVSFFGREEEDISLRLFTSYLEENSFRNIGDPKVEKAGTVNLPTLTATAMVNYRIDDFTFSMTGRYINDRVQYKQSGSAAAVIDDNTIDSVFYLNLRGSYSHRPRNGGKYSIYLNVANALDADPPVVASWRDFFGPSAFVPGVHDSLGRRYTLGFSFEF